LKVGHLLGADRVVFADVSIGYYPHKAQVGVTVRSIVVETGEIQWMGVAYYPVPIKDHQFAIHQATEYAFAAGDLKGHSTFQVRSGFPNVVLAHWCQPD
jgi:hypothetical protein